MTINKQSASYKIAHTMYLSLGGDPEKEFTSVEEIYQDVDQIYGESGGRVTVEPLKVELTTNGTTIFDDINITGYKPVEVSVNVDTSIAYEDGYNNGYDTGVLDGVEHQKSLLETLSVTENGTYNREDGWNSINVEVKGGSSINFGQLGYDNNTSTLAESTILDNIKYSKSLLDAWDVKTTYAYNLYAGNTILVYAPAIDVSNVTNFGYAFNGCTSLMFVPKLNLCKNTYWTGVFNNCTSLSVVENIDASSGTDLTRLFNSNKNLISVNVSNTYNVTTLSEAFNLCEKLTDLGEIDASSITNVYDTFYKCYALKNFGGFKNLGKQSSVSYTNTLFSYSSNLTHESIMNIINGLYDRSTNGMSILTLKFHADSLAKLSDEEKAIATNKGWTLS